LNLGCGTPFASEFNKNLVAFWKSYVLREATFGRFAQVYLSPAEPQRIHYTGNLGNVKRLRTDVYVSSIEPRQQLMITWGSQNFYAEPWITPPSQNAPQNNATAQEPSVAPALLTTPKLNATVQTSYSRSTSGGSTGLQIILDHGMRLFPPGTCAISSVSEDKNSQAPTQGEIQTPCPWKERQLLGNLFLPVYNLFDLHNPLLLSVNTASVRKNDCPDGLVTDVDPALGQKILDVAERERVSHVHHHDQTDDLWRAVEISERIAHAPRLTQPGQPENLL
jgi:hypothetical protein